VAVEAARLSAQVADLVILRDYLDGRSLVAAMNAPDLRRRWIRACVLGELIGFVPPALVGATLGAADASDLVMIGGLTAAGVAEGAVLGVAQGSVVSRFAPAVDGRTWAVATAAAAGFAWFAGMGSAAVIGADVVPVALAVTMVVPAWTAALLAMGIAQWSVLRRAVAHSARWVPMTAMAWAIGVVIPVVSVSLTPNGWPPWAFVVVGVVAAVAMGLTVGAITGTTLVRLLTPHCAVDATGAVR
jgi:hypothetical protein